MAGSNSNQKSESGRGHMSGLGQTAPQQPDYLDVAMGLRLQPPARTHPVQIPVNVELQEIARGYSSGGPVTSSTTWPNPAAPKSSPSTKASMNRTGSQRRHSRLPLPETAASGGGRGRRSPAPCRRRNRRRACRRQHGSAASRARSARPTCGTARKSASSGSRRDFARCTRPTGS
jgi:hypothetical protein